MSAVGVFGGPLAGKCRTGTARAGRVCGPRVGGVRWRRFGHGGRGGALHGSVFAWGFGVSVAGPALTALTNDVAPPARRGESLALSRTAADGALCVAPVALGLLADLAGSTAAPLRSARWRQRVPWASSGRGRGIAPAECKACVRVLSWSLGAFVQIAGPRRNPPR